EEFVNLGEELGEISVVLGEEREVLDVRVEVEMETPLGAAIVHAPLGLSHAVVCALLGAREVDLGEQEVAFG
ncbi:unnamed protein product, partial [Ilex paraguariensis]